MRFSTTKEKILDGVLMAERITGKKEALPILSCVVIDANKEVSVRATNLEAGIEVRIPGEIVEKGVVAVSANVLSQTLRAVGGDSITLKTEDSNLLIETRGTKTLIKAIPHEEFPTLPGSSENRGVEVDRGELLRSIQAVSYAASPSMIRPELGSIYISVGSGSLVCVATDSFRLAEKVMGGSGKGDAEILLPLKHAHELTHILERVKGPEVTLVADESQLTVLSEGVRFVSRIVEGTFPNYKEIVPKTFATEATVLKNDLSEILRKARVFSGNDQHVGIHVYPKRKVFTAIAHSADVGEMSDSIDAALSGEDIDINFHIGYLADCLPSVESDSLKLGFSGEGKPLVVQGVSDASFMYLVMPLNR